MAEPRTFKLTSPAQEGDDVKDWQKHVNWRYSEWSIDYPLVVDGVYGEATRAATGTLLYAFGVATTQMASGVTPELRTKIRQRRFTTAEERTFNSKARTNWRRRLRDKYDGGGVAPPLAKINTVYGYVRGGHDGADLICPANAHGYAICDAKVVGSRDDWWGKGSPGGAVADRGDGIVILQALVTIGPIHKGDYFGYGHAEHRRVKIGDRVKAGEWICDAGFANAWHFHWMHYRGNPGSAGSGRGPKGIGNRDPMPVVRYCQRNS